MAMAASKVGFSTGARAGAAVSRTRAGKAKASSYRSRAVRTNRGSAMTVRAEIGDTLEAFLVKTTPDPKLRTLMRDMGDCIRTIAFKVRTASCSATSCVNDFGDEQLAVDMLADKLLFETLGYSGVCEYACSEEEPTPQPMGGEGYSVAFDPLDGSSIVDTNFTVGTIFGVWPGSNLTGITGRDQAAAGMGIYGPRTVFCFALADTPGCHEFLLMDDGSWMKVKDTREISPGKLFAPGNLRATFDNPEYEKLVSYWVGEKYTLRYTGGMVPDVFQIVVKEKGVFSNVTSPTTKAKLRLLFEVAPLALIVEKAGGESSADGLCISALDIPIERHDQRTQVCYGSKEEVKRFEEFMYSKSPRFADVNVSA